MASAIVNGILVQGLSDENDNSSNPKEQIYMNGTATDTSDLLKSETVSSLFTWYIFNHPLGVISLYVSFVFTREPVKYVYLLSFFSVEISLIILKNKKNNGIINLYFVFT